MPRNLYLLPQCSGWMTGWLFGMEPYSGALPGQGMLGKLAGNISFQKLPCASHWTRHIKMPYFTLSAHQPPKEEVLSCFSDEETEAQGEEVTCLSTQVVKGRAKVRSYVRASAVPIVPQLSGYRTSERSRFWDASLWTLQRKIQVTICRKSYICIALERLKDDSTSTISFAPHSNLVCY